MTGWRDRIYSAFTAYGAPLYLVADPDGVLVEASVLQWLRDHRFELVTFEDPVAFRYLFESRIRGREDTVAVVRTEAADVSELPYDILQAGQRLSFSLSEIFPNLSPRIIGALDRSDFDELDRAYQTVQPERMGETATKDFILRHVFKFAPELINQPVDLLRMLLRRHYGGRQLPAIIDDRLVHLLKQKSGFPDWPLEAIVPDRTAFWAFLQERWPAYLDDRTGQVSEQSPTYRYPGPEILPFDHDEIRVFVDNLFREALLQPVDYPAADKIPEQWMQIGIRSDPDLDRMRRLRGMLDGMNIPADGARHQDWRRFAYRWAEIVVLEKELDLSMQDELRERISTMRSRIDTAFPAWALERYDGLSNQPPIPPVMAHHISRMLARRLDEGQTEKIALVLLDGLSLDQWIVLRNEIRNQDASLHFDEQAVFAWIPTITSVSRQAVFSGKPPLYFPETIHTTDRDAGHWSTFWQDQNIGANAIAYMRGLGGNDLYRVEEMMMKSTIKALGLVVDMVDNIMHGMELGAAGMHNQVRQWATHQYMTDMLNLLIDNGYDTILTSDHGNIEAVGCGPPSEGAIAEVRGARVRIYAGETNRQSVKSRIPDAICWPSYGLPDNYLPLLASGRTAFVHSDERIVGHGGASVEEVIVPMIRVMRSK